MPLVAFERRHVAAVWPLVGPLMERACSRGLSDITPAWLKAECERGHASVLATLGQDGRIRAAAIAQTAVEDDGSRVCHLLACGGSGIAGMKQAIPEFEAWARYQGARAARLSGRPGWERIFRGYRRLQTKPGLPYITLHKDL